jgi:hypothetical protein
MAMLNNQMAKPYFFPHELCKIQTWLQILPIFMDTPMVDPDLVLL